ncbi:MAG: nitroreductase [Muribaculaceae bacterium]|nr:nitroreductase [Muribaculaceae bacterium]
MTELEAIKARHSVRRYLDKPIEHDKADALRAAIDRCNSASGLHIQLVVNEPLAFSTGVWKYGKFHGVTNYLVMAGARGDAAEENVGYYGEHLVLLAQQLGLNTCWVGLTFKKVDGAFELNDGEVVHCVISIGYGEDQGVQHPMRPVEKFYKAQGTAPQWFLRGMEAALLAPTAIHQQKFTLVLHEDNTVEARTRFSLAAAGYLRMDLGIVKYHFEVGAGKENFTWR